jgi:hypothetical protein
MHGRRQGGARGEWKRTNRFFTYRWQWWVISPNSTKFGFGGVPLEALHENYGVGDCSTFFWSRSAVKLLELGVFDGENLE